MGPLIRPVRMYWEQDHHVESRKPNTPLFGAAPTQRVSRVPVPPTSHLSGAVTDSESVALVVQVVVIASVLILTLAMDSDRGSIYDRTVADCLVLLSELSQ